MCKGSIENKRNACTGLCIRCPGNHNPPMGNAVPHPPIPLFSQAAQLPTDQLQYMRRTADMGKRKETQKQRLRRELIEEKAGLPVPEDSRLHQKRAKMEGGDSDEEEAMAALAGKKAKTGQVCHACTFGVCAI